MLMLYIKDNIYLKSPLNIFEGVRTNRTPFLLFKVTFDSRHPTVMIGKKNFSYGPILFLKNDKN